MQIVKNTDIKQAHQWFKNGDLPNEDPAVEGSIVRYYRHPDIPGQALCKKCQHTVHEHGWIDQGDKGLTVCPGDYVIQLSPIEYIVKSQKDIETEYTIVEYTKMLDKISPVEEFDLLAR